MFTSKSNNADISQYDWVQRDRAVLLHSLYAARAPRAPVVFSSGFGTDVIRNDPRSVRACLAGKGDLRVTWWNLFSAVYMGAVPGATLERAMCSFHSIHHAVTLSRLEFARSVAQTSADIEQNGVLTAACRFAMREIKR